MQPEKWSLGFGSQTTNSMTAIQPALNQGFSCSLYRSISQTMKQTQCDYTRKVSMHLVDLQWPYTCACRRWITIKVQTAEQACRLAGEASYSSVKKCNIQGIIPLRITKLPDSDFLSKLDRRGVGVDHVVEVTMECRVAHSATVLCRDSPPGMIR